MNEHVTAMPPSPPPRQPNVRRVLPMLLAGLAGLAIGVLAAGPIRAGAGRLLSRAGADTEPTHADSAAGYTCGMHPWVLLPEPGLCPICHMALTPVDPSRLTGEIVIDPVTVQNIGVRIAPVVRGPVVREVRTVGTVGYDETRVRVATSRTGGWIETLHVAAEGAEVAVGDPLFELYSPELYAAQVEYLLAYRGRSGPGGEALLNASRARLEYLGLSAQQIVELERAGQASRTITVHSPHAGVVTELLVREGARIEPGAPTHRIADLTHVWVLAAVYEHQMPFVQAGQPATMTLPFVPGRTFEGEVAKVYPYLDAASRQGRVRLEFDNPDGVLKPGMLAQVELKSSESDAALLVPREAVLVTGERSIAFVSLGEGRFEPREVATGVVGEDGRVEVLSGLREGENVVTSGQFLLDGESRMRSALAKMVRGDVPEAGTGTGAGEASHVHAELPEPISAATQAAADAIARHYLAITRALARDSTDGLAAHYAAIGEAAARVDHALAAEVGAAAASPPEDMDALRTHLERLSAAVIALLSAAPPAIGETLYVAHCPMVEARWLQTESQVTNPYMGPTMHDCGTIEHALPAGGDQP